MKVTELMTAEPACCTPDTSLEDVARLMLEHDCGAIPVVASLDSQKPVGIVTDRDIACRAVATGKNPMHMTAKDVMSSPARTIKVDSPAEECFRLMEERQIRRVAVVDARGRCCGIVAQADIARHAPEQETAEIVREVSEPARGAFAR
jgi:CBS domain-containing protein